MSRVGMEELDGRLVGAEAEVVGKKWRHIKTGDVYDALWCVLRETDLEPLVVYSRSDWVTVRFSRPVTEFLERFVPA